MNLYELLDIEKTADEKEIKSAYKKQAKIHHPDKGGDAETFSKLKEAYDVLIDPIRRKRYDDTGMISEPVNFEIQFKDFVNQVIIPIFKQNDISFLGRPLMSQVNDVINNSYSSAERTLENMKQEYTELGLARKKIKYKGEKTNIIGEAIQTQLDITSNRIQQKKLEIEFLKNCKSELENYEYEEGERLEMEIPENLIGRFSGFNIK